MLLFALLVVGLVSPAAQAAFPGQNGKIAFGGRNANGDFNNLYSINPNGTGLSQLTTDRDAGPAWSPDGSRIAFVSLRQGAPEIYVMNADGSAETRLTNSTSNDGAPSWTPDGSKIVWANDFEGTYDIWSMNPDGTGQVKVGGSATEDDAAPVMSPDGSRIAFERSGHVWLMDPDGTNEQHLAEGSRPDWSPDGAKLTFSRTEYLGCSNDPVEEVPVSQIFRMTADGTSVTQMTHSVPFSCFGAPQNNSPVWSPNGAKIAWSEFTESFSTSADPDDDLLIMDSDGTNAQSLGNQPLKTAPDWQPVQPGYPRPKGATPFRASLVPAYIACASPNRTHGPPLAFPSCSPANERSSVLTVGTPDANGAPAKMIGALTLAVVPGNPATPADDADMAISVSVTDVRCAHTNAACPAGAGSDYDGKLLALPVSTRITDRQNTPPGPSGVPGTGDTQFKMPVVCAPTADTTVGSTCSLSTTADALMPGVIREGARAIWELGQVHVRDAGPNGTGYESPACPPDCGDGDETLFLRQGVFVP
jgi:WD40-like Beta Propeller Repeat